MIGQQENHCNSNKTREPESNYGTNHINNNKFIVNKIESIRVQSGPILTKSTESGISEPVLVYPFLNRKYSIY